MPTDEELRSEFLVKDVYNFRSRNYLLRKLENHDRKEPVEVDSYTIEHVLPQNPDLSPEWQEELGPDWKTVQEQYLHTIGNLTLTGYNPELSDRPFSEKLTMKGGFRDSPLRLNHYLASSSIGTRRRSRSGRAARRPGPPDLASAEASRGNAREVPQDEGQGSAVYTLDDHPALEGRDPSALRRAPPAGPRTSTPVSTRRFASSTSPTSWRPTSSRWSRWLASSSCTSTSAVEELDDPLDLGRDVTKVGHWGTGSVEVRLKTSSSSRTSWRSSARRSSAKAKRATKSRSGRRPASSASSRSDADPAVQEALLEVVESAVRNGLYPRPWKRSLMFAPPANRSRALFTLDHPRRRPRRSLLRAGGVRDLLSARAGEVERQLGPAGPTALQVAEVAALADRLDELMVDAEAITDGQSHGRPGMAGTSTSRSATGRGRTPGASASSRPAAATFYTKPLENGSSPARACSSTSRIRSRATSVLASSRRGFGR